MNVLIQLGHPAHFHLYKNVIKQLNADNHKTFVLIKKKDVLEDLLINANIPYINILPEGRKDSKFAIMWGMIRRLVKLFFFSKKNKIFLLTGSTPEVAQIGWLTRKYSIITAEDDATVIPTFISLAKPFIDGYISPNVCDNSSIEFKSTKYASYHELAYLHPNHFTPDKSFVEKYFSIDKPYFILRFAKLNAYHDSGIQGINTEIAQHLIDILKPYGNIYITAERELEPEFEQYRIRINPLDMHHVMAYATLYIGDSQTMAAEAGVLGVPFVRFNDFVGRIGYLRELEEVYHLGYGVKPSNVDDLYKAVKEILAMTNRKEVYQERRKKFLDDKIDFAKFLTWFIESYPQSKEIMKTNPDFQYKFK